MNAFAEKRIYLAGRHPGLSPEAFVERWRNHFRLAASRPRWRNIRRYWQYDPLPAARGEGHDAIAQLWFRSPDAARRHFLETQDQAEMEADEREIFSDMIRNRILAVEETVVRAGAVGAVVLFRFLRRKPGVGFGEFAESCRRSGDALVADGSRFVSNLDALRGERSVGLDADAVDEIHFASADAALRFVEGPGADPLAREAELVASVLTRPVPLYDIEGNVPAPAGQ